MPASMQRSSSPFNALAVTATIGVWPGRLPSVSASRMRWLTVANTKGHSATGNGEGGHAIDRSVLGAWLGDDQSAIDQLLKKFEDTAADTQREIDSASRNNNLARPPVRDRRPAA